MRNLLLTLLALTAGGRAAASQSPLQAVVDWGDGITRSSAITTDATESPNDHRFWVGHGVRRAQIRVGDRVRDFSEEIDQNYSSEVVDLEYDEFSSVVDDHRLFVLTAYQPKTGVPARLQYLDASTPAAPTEIAVIDLVDPSVTPASYEFSSIRVVPEQKLLLAVGAVRGATTVDNEPLVILFRYGQPSPTETDQLVKLAESRPGQFVLPCNVQGHTHDVIGAEQAYVHQIGNDTVALATLLFAPHGKPLPRGVGVFTIDADAPLEQDRLTWRTTPQHFIDPAALDFGCGVPQPAGYANSVAVSSIDFVAVEGPNQTVQHLAYMACGSKWQVREYDIGNLLGSAGFPAPRQIDLPYGGPTDVDDLLWIAARHDPAENIDLLYVAGRFHLYCAHRTLVPASYAQTTHALGGPNLEGHVVLEDTTSTNGDREHVWTVAAETNYPWSIWDMTDRFHNPAVEAPQLLETHYAPGGCDGAVAIPELESVYVPTFNGVVRYDAGQTFTGQTAFLEPVYGSYRASIVPGSGSHVVEQIDTVRFSATDHRLYSPDGRGDLLEWDIHPTTKRPGVPRLIELDWGVSWAASYGNRATAGWSEHADRPYLLVDHFTTQSAPPFGIRVGRYWPPYGGQNAVWQVLDLKATADPEDELQHYVKDVQIAGDWGMVAMHNGIVVLGLGNATDPMAFTAVDTFYTVPTALRPDRFINGVGYPDVEGVAGIPGTIAVSAGKLGDAGATIALLAQDEVTGVITGIDYIVWDGEGVDGIPGTDFMKPGPLRFFEIAPGVHRLYAGCSFSGAILEFPVEPDNYGTWLGTPQVWHDGTHPNAVSDVRAYDVGHASGLPLILVARYRQTIALLAASGMLPEDP